MKVDLHLIHLQDRQTDRQTDTQKHRYTQIQRQTTLKQTATEPLQRPVSVRFCHEACAPVFCPDSSQVLV